MWTFLKSLLNLLQYCFCCFLFCLLGCEVCGIPTRGWISFGRQSLNHWAPREVPLPFPTQEGIWPGKTLLLEWVIIKYCRDHKLSSIAILPLYWKNALSHQIEKTWTNFLANPIITSSRAGHLNIHSKDRMSQALLKSSVAALLSFSYGMEVEISAPPSIWGVLIWSFLFLLAWIIHPYRWSSY